MFGVDVESAVEPVTEALTDECSRCILVAAYDRPCSVADLAEHCDTSEATVYRRLDTLTEHDLVVERLEPEERGHHYTVYRTNVDTVEVEVTASGLDLTVTRRESMADRFTRLIEEM